LSWLRLRPGPTGGDGRLRPQDLQGMDLGSCGTLVLGACESGMAQRVGRDERTGFVRAGLHAGAASVVAARWVAAAPAAEAVLAGFERYLRFLPRDLALRQAQLDVRDGVAGLSAPVPDIDHPVWWACWTLYGDAGHQTRAGALRRLLRRRLRSNRRRPAATGEEARA
jgi:CHAT domain-containing protein